MAKYRITENQLQKIFEDLEIKNLNEMDNFNYPAGSDTADAPWNQNINHTTPMTVNGIYSLLYSNNNEFLIKDTSKNTLLYTIKLNFEMGNEDMYDIISDFLEIPLEPYEDENGKGDAYADDWKNSIDDLGPALVSFMNYNQKMGKDLHITNLIDNWEMGEFWFLEINNQLAVSPELNDAIMSPEVLNMIKSFKFV